MTPQEAHEEARRGFDEADAGCDLDQILKLYAGRILGHYETFLWVESDGSLSSPTTASSHFKEYFT